jgi:NADPH-dependent curcumin reductase CurA
VGSIAAQLARDAGARVIGIAGGPEKTRFLLDELKLDAAIDYKNEDVAAALKENAGDGIDLYFDNVGGDILDAVLMQMNYQGTLVICGGISQYGDMKNASGPKEYLQLVMQSLRMQGFTMRDYLARIPEALSHLTEAQQDGKLVFREHIIEGIENFPAAVRMLYSGENHGKLILKIEH